MAHDPVAACAADAARMAQGALSAGLGEAGCGALLERLEARIATALDEAGAGPEAPACAPGCSACCTVNVATTALEGIALACWLRGALPAAEVARRARALLAFHAQVRWYDDADRIRGRLRCPFLEERGTCAVHPARPLACREVTSLDAGECRRALAERAAEEGEGLVRMNLVQRALYGEARQAVAGALAARGLDARARDVSGMAGIFLADPALAQAWLAGARLPLD